MDSLTKEQLEFCEVCENQKYTIKQGLICDLTEKPADFDKECNRYKENIELKTFREYFRHRSFIYERTAGIEVRLINYFIDHVCILIIAVLANFLIGHFTKEPGNAYEGNKFSYVFYTLIFTIVYYVILEGFTGRTIGKLITGTKLITTDCKKPTVYSVFIRTICRYIPLEPLSFLGDEPTGWHDDLSKTVVIFK